MCSPEQRTAFTPLRLERPLGGDCLQLTFQGNVVLAEDSGKLIFEQGESCYDFEAKLLVF